MYPEVMVEKTAKARASGKAKLTDHRAQIIPGSVWLMRRWRVSECPVRQPTFQATGYQLPVTGVTVHSLANERRGMARWQIEVRLHPFLAWSVISRSTCR